MSPTAIILHENCQHKAIIRVGTLLVVNSNKFIRFDFIRKLHSKYTINITLQPGTNQSATKNPGKFQVQEGQVLLEKLAAGHSSDNL